MTEEMAGKDEAELEKEAGKGEAETEEADLEKVAETVVEKEAGKEEVEKDEAELEKVAETVVEKEAGKEGEEFESAPPEEADAEFATLADDEFDAFGDGDSSMARLPPVEASIGFDDPFSFDEPAAAPPPAVPAAVDDSWGAF